MTRSSSPSNAPSFAEAFWYWLKLGFVSFGGPAGQIAMMQTELVDRRRWIDQRRFLSALNFCMMLPGPEAQQLATFVGWRLHGIAGGLAAGILFVLPGAVVLLVLSYVAAAHGEAPLVAAAFDGVKPVVVAILALALARIAGRTLRGWAPAVLATAAFAGLYWAGIPFPAIILGAGLVGLVGGRFGAFHAGGAIAPTTADDAEAAPGVRRFIVLLALFVVLWAAPVALVVALLGTTPWGDIAQLFTTAAFVTFGGAYAVLPYVADIAVAGYGWLSPDDMVRGLALAETTPGPLILVTQFVGFFAGWGNPGALSPAAAGILGSALTLYVTFLPCFLFIFAGAPYVEKLTRYRSAEAALTAITAAVVGVMANLAVFLAEAALWPDGPVDGVAVAIAAAAFIALWRGRMAVHWVVLAGAGLGLARAALGAA